MSERQKVFASLSGAVVVHVLLLMLVFALLSSRSIGSSHRPGLSPGLERPKEVTIMMDELLERIEIEPPEPEPETPREEPEPEPEPERRARPFIDAETNVPEAEAPENARFESDRNTSAATELLPDPNLPQRYGPTTRGDSPLPYLRLQERRFVDGQFDRPPSPASAAAPSAPASPPSSPSEGQVARSERTDAAPAPEEGEGEDSESAEGADTPPEQAEGEERLRPAATETNGDDEETMSRRSFTDPNSPTPVLPSEVVDDADRFASSRPDEEAEEGEAADEAGKRELAAAGKGVDREEAADADASGESAKQKARSADKGLFAPGFSPEDIQNSANGTLTNRGQNAVDAEETAVGRYKAQVRAVIARKWHRYRVDHGDFVTWGILKLECRIDRHGKVHGLKITKNEANSVLADFSLRAILDADIPPMPADVAEELGSTGLELKYDVIIY